MNSWCNVKAKTCMDNPQGTESERNLGLSSISAGFGESSNENDNIRWSRTEKPPVEEKESGSSPSAVPGRETFSHQLSTIEVVESQPFTKLWNEIFRNAYWVRNICHWVWPFETSSSAISTDLNFENAINEAGVLNATVSIFCYKDAKITGSLVLGQNWFFRGPLSRTNLDSLSNHLSSLSFH